MDGLLGSHTGRHVVANTIVPWSANREKPLDSIRFRLVVAACAFSFADAIQALHATACLLAIQENRWMPGGAYGILR